MHNIARRSSLGPRGRRTLFWELQSSFPCARLFIRGCCANMTYLIRHILHKGLIEEVFVSVNRHVWGINIDFWTARVLDKFVLCVGVVAVTAVGYTADGATESDSAHVS